MAMLKCLRRKSTNAYFCSSSQAIARMTINSTGLLATTTVFFVPPRADVASKARAHARKTRALASQNANAVL